MCYNLLVKIGGNKNWILAETMIKALIFNQLR
jgi:hypothetical protein